MISGQTAMTFNSIKNNFLFYLATAYAGQVTLEVLKLKVAFVKTAVVRIIKALTNINIWRGRSDGGRRKYCRIGRSVACISSGGFGWGYSTRS